MATLSNGFTCVFISKVDYECSCVSAHGRIFKSIKKSKTVAFSKMRLTPKHLNGIIQDSNGHKVSNEHTQFPSDKKP